MRGEPNLKCEFTCRILQILYLLNSNISWMVIKKYSWQLHSIFIL